VNNESSGNHPDVQQVPSMTSALILAILPRILVRLSNHQLSISNGEQRASNGWADFPTNFRRPTTRGDPTLFAPRLLEHGSSDSAYLVGSAITEADWRLFTTLVRL